METTENKNNQEQKADKFKKIRHTIIEYLSCAVAVWVVMAILFCFILIHAYFPSESMESTLMTGDRVIGNRLAYKFGNDPERFDVVIFYAPDEENTLYVKRVIGLPDETVTIKDGKVYINGDSTPLDDSFVNEEMDEEDEMTFHVPEGCYFMMGDNRNHSYDSRRWDNPYVNKDKIVAKVCFRYWKGFKKIS